MTFLLINYFLLDSLLDSFNLLIFFLLNLLIFNTLFCLLVNNPVYSILFLALSFITFAVLLFLLGLHLIGFLFLLVYIGGISVLLLFVLMLLNIRFLLFENKYSFSFILFFIIFFIGIEISFLIFMNKYTVDVPLYTYFDFAALLYSQDMLFVLGVELYNNYTLSIIFSGILLMLSLIASISMVMFKKLTKRQLVSMQLQSDLLDLKLTNDYNLNNDKKKIIIKKN